MAINQKEARRQPGQRAKDGPTPDETTRLGRSLTTAFWGAVALLPVLLGLLPQLQIRPDASNLAESVQTGVRLWVENPSLVPVVIDTTGCRVDQPGGPATISAFRPSASARDSRQASALPAGGRYSIACHELGLTPHDAELRVRVELSYHLPVASFVRFTEHAEFSLLRLSNGAWKFVPS